MSGTRTIRERYDFERAIIAEGGTADLARRLMRAATTLHRLAEAQCNGDWPCDNGERKVAECDGCKGLWAPSVLKTSLTQRKLDRRGGMARAIFEGLAVVEYPYPGFSDARPHRLCPDCRTEARVRAMLPEGWGVSFQSDPRGAVMRLHVPSKRDEGWGGLAVA